MLDACFLVHHRKRGGEGRGGERRLEDEAEPLGDGRLVFLAGLRQYGDLGRKPRIRPAEPPR